MYNHFNFVISLKLFTVITVTSFTYLQIGSHMANHESATTGHNEDNFLSN